MKTEPIQETHRQKLACIYLRQSTLKQVRQHQESTERQYALKDKALQLGWPLERILILDRDLGISGTQTANRPDFQRLVSLVSLQKVGAVFALEVSRLSRSDLDWHRLVDLCGWTSALLIDEDGTYNPGDFNDRLLLGLKGTMSQAELHFLRVRLQGGKLSKARKGQLRFPLPVGFVYNEPEGIVLDPDQEVQSAVRLVFTTFGQLASAYGVVQHFADHQLLFPKRSYGGVWHGQLRWARLHHGRVLCLLRNPAYAGAYVFGRYRACKSFSPTGQMHNSVRRMPLSDWQVHLPNQHPGYITWEEYLANQQRLAQNQTKGGPKLAVLPCAKGRHYCRVCWSAVSAATGFHLAMWAKADRLSGTNATGAAENWPAKAVGRFAATCSTKPWPSGSYRRWYRRKWKSPWALWRKSNSATKL